jgi:hypothetical protein
VVVVCDAVGRDEGAQISPEAVDRGAQAVSLEVEEREADMMVMAETIDAESAFGECRHQLVVVEEVGIRRWTVVHTYQSTITRPS